MFFLSLCVGCFRSHTVLCVLGKHSGSHTCILCVVMVAPPPSTLLHSVSFPSPPPFILLLLSSPFPFYLTPLFPSTVSCLTPLLPVTLPLTLTPLLPISLPTHSSPSTPPLSLLSYPVGPSLSAGNSVWNRPVCGAGCLLCASHPLRTVSLPPLISGDYITVCISVQELTQWPSLWITHR